MRIANHDVTQKILIVAEIGNNHEGNFEVACRMVEAAADAGVDAVKFQTFKTRLFTSKADPARFERLSKFELTQDQFRALEQLARARGLIFLPTPLDLESAAFLAPLVDVFKVASGKLPLPGKVRQQASGQARTVAASTAWPIDCQKKNRRSL